jgi:hypothetical protein
MASPLPTVIDYSTIKSLHISFQNTAMSFHYSDDAQLFAEFFDDNGIDLDENLHEHLVENVKICLETNTLGDYRRIPLLQQKMFYRYQCPKTNAFKGLRTDEHLKQAFNDAIETNRTSLHVIVMTDNLFFLPTFSGANLDHIHESEDDLNDAIADAITNATAVPPVISAPAFSAPIGSSSSAAITQPAPVPKNEFRHHLLPPDVKKRYDDHQNTDKIVPVSDLVPFVATSTAKTPLNYFHETYIPGVPTPPALMSRSMDSVFGIDSSLAMEMHVVFTLCPTNFWTRIMAAPSVSLSLMTFPSSNLDTTSTGRMIFFALSSILPCSQRIPGLLNEPEDIMAIMRY